MATDFYLTGGTAVSRCYLHHRFSDDLDLFVNYDKRFVVWANLVITALSSEPHWQVTVTKNEEFFARLLLQQNDVTLKIEMINDVPSHVGEIRQHPVLGRVDSPENILGAHSKVVDFYPPDLARWLCMATVKDRAAGGGNLSGRVSGVG